MAGLTVYGESGSRALRALWMVEECGLDYEHVPTTFAVGAKTPEYKAINPNGRIPAIDDEGTVIWESMAINLYLAKKYGGELGPRDLTEEGHMLQWSFWVMTEVEKSLLNALFSAVGMMGVEKDVARAKVQFLDISDQLDVLNEALDGNEYLVGDRFTVADLNVASVLSWSKMGPFDLTGWPKVEAWLERCLGREAMGRARAR
jgi:glutathione S-transferase